MAFNKDPCANMWPPFSLSCLSAVITIIICLITIPGNFLICLAILRDPHKELRTSFNYLLLNVALADLLLAIICEPIAIVYYVREALVIEGITCCLWISHITFFITSTASLLSITALAIERYLGTSSNFVRNVPPRRAIYISFGIWIVSIIVPWLYFSIGAFTFAFVFINAVVVFTLGICCFTYIHISLRLRHSISLLTSYGSNTAEVAIKRERRVTRTFILILVTFACCNLPSFVFAYIVVFCDTCSCDVIHWSRDFFFRCVMFNCAINQFLYAWRTPSFLKAIQEIVGTCVRRNRIHPQVAGAVTSRTDGETV